MGLPWFAFNIKDFLANTKRLNTEAKGAYLMLMLDYYEQECGPPDDDDVLATITELPEAVWKRHRKVIAPFFRIADGYWHHDRVESEMLEATAKHARRSAHAQTAALAKHGKKPPQDAPSIPAASPKQKKTPKPAPGMPSASPPSSPEEPHLTNTLTLSTESVNARAQGDEIGSNDKEDFNPLGTVLPADWIPDDEDVGVALGYGMDNTIVHEQLLIFHALNAQNGTFSKNWKGTWRVFCSRWKDLRKTTPPPRVEVNNQPTAENWDRACALWAKGSSSWPYKSLGPEPGQIGCKCPNIFLTKHHIDPQTGLVAAPSKEPVS